MEEIDKAYRKRIKEYHPDRVNMLGEKLQVVAKREFERIQQAYRSLAHHRARPAASLGTSPGLNPHVAHKNVREYTIEDYQNIIELDPANDAAYYNLAIRYFEKGLIDMAIQAYQEALRINPGNVDAAHNLKLAELARSLAK